MPINHLGIDIETVPNKSLEAYNQTIQEKVRDKIKHRQERNPDFDYNYFASIHGDFGKIICISLGYVTEENSIRLKSLSSNDEFQILTDFNEIINNHRGIFIHYNGLNFDVPFILQRMSYHGIVPSHTKFTSLRRYSTEPHFDVMMQYYNWDKQNVLPLGILAELHGLPNPKSELSGEKVYEAYKNEEWSNIVHYCEFDTATVLNLWWKIFRNNSVIPYENYIFSK